MLAFDRTDSSSSPVSHWRRTGPIILLACGWLSGCANLGAVSDFGKQADALAQSFMPMVAAATRACVDSRSERAVLADRAYDPAEIRKQADAQCVGASKSGNEAVLKAAQALSAYAGALIAAADGSAAASVGTADASLATAIGGLKGPDKAPILSATETAAVGKLVELLAKWATQQQQTVAIQDALTQRAGLEALTLALTTYATQNYGSALRDQIRDIDELLTLSPEPGERIAVNLAKESMFRARESAVAQLDAIGKFEKAAASMLASHADLAANLGKLDRNSRIVALKAFRDDLIALRDAMTAAF